MALASSLQELIHLCSLLAWFILCSCSLRYNRDFSLFSEVATTVKQKAKVMKSTVKHSRPLQPQHGSLFFSTEMTSFLWVVWQICATFFIVMYQCSLWGNPKVHGQFTWLSHLPLCKEIMQGAFLNMALSVFQHDVFLVKTIYFVSFCNQIDTSQIAM